jgi:hypothetical protein
MTYKPALIFLTFLAQAFFSLVLIIITIWGSLALYYQLSESRLITYAVIALWVVIALVAFSTIWFSDL